MRLMRIGAGEKYHLPWERANVFTLCGRDFWPDFDKIVDIPEEEIEQASLCKKCLHANEDNLGTQDYIDLKWTKKQE